MYARANLEWTRSRDEEPRVGSSDGRGSVEEGCRLRGQPCGRRHARSPTSFRLPNPSVARSSGRGGKDSTNNSGIQPRRLAAEAARTRSELQASPNSAIAPQTWNAKRPAAVFVSMPSFGECSSHPALAELVAEAGQGEEVAGGHLQRSDHRNVPSAQGVTRRCWATAEALA